LAAAHLTLVPELKAALVKEGRGDIMIVVGGVVPPQDYAELEGAGVEAIFPPGTVIAEAAELLLDKLAARLGHGREAAEEPFYLRDQSGTRSRPRGERFADLGHSVPPEDAYHEQARDKRWRPQAVVRLFSDRP